MTTLRYDRAKRALDLSVAIPLIVITIPVQLVIATVIGCVLGRPVFFRQTRPGLNGEPFELIKFRSMLNFDPALDRNDDASRMTPLGRFLRSSSLDELPTFWNVLRGDMSLVGPRPLLMSYLARYSTEQARRHEVRPGITGLAQVSGRNSIEWADRLALDIKYVDSRSFRVDAQILLATIPSVIKQKNTSAQGHVTMPEFMPTNQDRAAE